MKKVLKHVGAAAFAGGLLLFLYWMKGLFPFGESTVSWCDMNQQVIPLLCEFQDILAGKGSLFLNLQNAGGMNFWGVFLFFISSPFSFLAAFVEKWQMFRFANILVLLKMMLCAGCASVFFDRAFPKLRPAFGVLLSVGYSFCGYTMLFYQNVVWLDMMYLFPLFLLSLLHLERTGSFVPYALCLTAMITVNFYLGYMLVLFLILAAGLWVLFFTPANKRGQLTVQLAAGTVSAALLSAVVWLPALMEYLQSARGGNLFQSLGSGSFFTPLSTIGMLLLCNTILLPAFVFQAVRCANKEMDGAYEQYLLMLFSLMMIPAVIEPINKIWHTGSYQAFPGRYGYILVFLGLCLAAQLLQPPKGKHRSGSRLWTAVVLLLAGATVFTAWFLYTNSSKTLSVYTRTLWGNDQSLRTFLLFFLPAAACIGLALILYRRQLLSRRMMVLCLCALTVTDSLFYGSCFFACKSEQSFVNVTRLENRIEDDSFFRVKNNRKNYDVNLTGAVGYNTLNHYTSLTREDYMHGIRKLGYSSYWMEVSSVGGTLISDALLNQKYTIYRQGTAPQNPIYADDVYCIVPNDLSLPLGLVTSADLSSCQDLSLIARPRTGEQLLQTLSGDGRSIVQEYAPTFTHNLSVTRDGDFYKITRQGSGDSFIEYQLPASDQARTYYFDCFDSLENNLSEPYYKAFSIYVNGELLAKEYPTQSLNGILQLTVASNQPVHIAVTVHKNVSVRSFGVFSVSHPALEQALSSVRTAPMQVGKDRVSGSAFAEEDGEYLFLSLPYDQGYTAFVNGKEVPVLRVFDCWMAVPLSQGENQIELRYRPPGFVAGSLLSAAGCILLPLAGWFLTRRGLRLRFLEKPAVLLLSLLTAGTVAAVYLLPLIVYLAHQLFTL